MIAEFRGIFRGNVKEGLAVRVCDTILGAVYFTRDDQRSWEVFWYEVCENQTGKYLKHAFHDTRSRDGCGLNCRAVYDTH